MFIKILSVLVILSFVQSCSTTQPVAKSESVGIDREVVREQIRNRLPDFKKCYDTEYNQNKTVQGKVVLRFSFDEDGEVTKASVVEEKSTLLLPTLNKCMTDTVSTITFPPAPKGQVAEVVYPFMFKATH